jgi:hypothetical protein
VSVDEARRHHPVARVDDQIDAAFEALPDVQDAIPLDDDAAVAQQPVLASLERHDQRRVDACPVGHVCSPRSIRSPARRAY